MSARPGPPMTGGVADRHALPAPELLVIDRSDRSGPGRVETLLAERGADFAVLFLDEVCAARAPASYHLAPGGGAVLHLRDARGGGTFSTARLRGVWAEALGLPRNPMTAFSGDEDIERTLTAVGEGESWMLGLSVLAVCQFQSTPPRGGRPPPPAAASWSASTPPAASWPVPDRTPRGPRRPWQSKIYPPMPALRLPFGPTASTPARTISPLLELGAYEELWSDPSATFRRIAEKFRQQPDALPSDLVPRARAEARAKHVLNLLRTKGVQDFGVRINRASEYPRKLRDAQDPVELLYYQGWWGLVERPSVAVVGTRNPSPEGRRRTRTLVRQLVEDGWTIVSGLAAGVDTEAHRTALAHDGQTIAVLGTPLSETYPKENRELQARLAEDYLVVSQVPISRYYQQTWKVNRHFFPERNITMSALTEATIIVEAGNTSGTLTQARAALQQGRKLLILENCFQNPDLTWPAKFAERGALRIKDFAEVRSALGLAHRDR